MSFRNPSLYLALASGVVVGLFVAAARPTTSRAQDTSAAPLNPADAREYQTITGPYRWDIDSTTKSLVPVDAVYYIDYRAARLLAGIPSGPTSATEVAAGGADKLSTTFAERDLVADFQVPGHIRPHFIMSVARMGIANRGTAPLYVFETETGQVAMYLLNPQMVGTKHKSELKLVERKALPKSGLPPVNTP